MKHVTELLENTELFDAGPRIGTMFVNPQEYFAHSNLLYAADQSAKLLESLRLDADAASSLDQTAEPSQAWNEWVSGRRHDNESNAELARMTDWISRHTLDVILSPAISARKGSVVLGNLVMRAALQSAREGKRDISVLEVLSGPFAPVGNWFASSVPHGKWFAHELAVAHNIGFRYASPADRPEWPTVAIGLALHPQDHASLPFGYIDYSVMYTHHRIRGELLIGNSGSFESQVAANGG